MSTARQLVFIADGRQFDACQGPWSDARRPVVYDHDLIHRLRESGTEFVNAWDYLDEAAAARGDAAAWSLCDALGSFHSDLPDVPLNLCERCQDDYLYPFRFALNTATVVSRCLDALRPDSVAVFSECREAFNWDPTNPPPDVFNAVVRWCAEQRGLKVELLSLSSPEEGELSEAIARRPHPVEPKADLLMFANFLSVPERELLLRSPSIRKYAMINVCDRAEVPYIAERLLDLLPFRAAARRLSATEVRRHMQAVAPEARCVTDNPHFDFVWEHFVRKMESVERCFRAGRFVARASGARLALLGYPVMGYLRALREGLSIEGCQSLAVNHSGLSRYSTWKRHRGDRGPLAVWGAWERDVLSRHRKPSEPMHMTGSLRRDIQSMMSASPEIPSAGEPVIVILTGRITHLYAATADVNAHWRMWDDVLALIRGKPEWRFIIKPHPRYDHVPVYQSARFAALPNLQIFKGTIAESLRGASAAIAFNNMTTGCLEPLARNIPLISLENAIRVDERGQLEEGAFTVTTVHELETALERLVNEPEARAERIRAGRAFLHRVVHASGQDAVDHYIRLMDDMLEKVPARAPCPASAWLLRLLMTIQHVMTGGKEQEPSRMFADVKAAGYRLVFNLHDLFDVHQLGECFLSMAAWGPWPTPLNRDLPSIRHLVRWVYHALPDAIRPSWRVYRRYLVEASRRDIRQAQNAGDACILDRARLALIAPKTLLTGVG